MSPEGVFVGTTEDGQYDVYVPYDVLMAEQEDAPVELWPTPDDWAMNFNDRDEAIVVPHRHESAE